MLFSETTASAAPAGGTEEAGGGERGRGRKKNKSQATLLYVSVHFHVRLSSGRCLLTSGVFESTRQRESLLFILAQLAQILKGHHGGHTGQISGKDLPNSKDQVNERAELPKCPPPQLYVLLEGPPGT